MQHRRLLFSPAHGQTVAARTHTRLSIPMPVARRWEEGVQHARHLHQKKNSRSSLVLVLYLSSTCMHVSLQIPVSPCLAFVLELLACLATQSTQFLFALRGIVLLLVMVVQHATVCNSTVKNIVLLRAQLRNGSVCPTRYSM